MNMGCVNFTSYSTSPIAENQIKQIPNSGPAINIISIINSVFHTFNSNTLRIVGIFVSFDNVAQKIFISQEAIGKRVGITREYANKVIKMLCELNVIKKKYRHNQTCLYTLNPVFRMPEVRRHFAPRIPQLNYMHLVMLFSAINPCHVTEFTQKIYVSNSSKESIFKRASANTHMRARGSEMEISNSRVLKLTKAGQARLSPFPKAALEYADGEMMKLKTAPQDPFRYYTKVCNEWCKKNNQVPEWSKMYRALEYYAVGEGDHSLAAKFEPRSDNAFKKRYSTPGVMSDNIYTDINSKNKNMISPISKIELEASGRDLDRGAEYAKFGETDAGRKLMEWLNGGSISSLIGKN